MEIDLGTIYVSIILLTIDFYSETQIKNYGSLLERIVYLLKIKSLFNIVKLLVFFCSLLIFFNLFPIDLLSISLNTTLEKFYLNGLLTAGSCSIFITFYNSKSISTQFGNYYLSSNFSKINTFISNFQYFIYRLVSFSLIFFIFIFLIRSLNNLNISLHDQKLGIFDWLIINAENADNYNKGVYFSMVLTAILFFIFNNAFLKRESTFFQFRDIRWGF